MGDKDVETLGAMADLVTPMAIRVAATLRLADRLDRPRTAAELAGETGTNPDALERLMRHLVTVGVLDRDDAARFTATELGTDLCGSDLRADLDIEGPFGRGDLSLTALLHSVRTGGPAFPAEFGEPYWTDLAADPVRARAFDDARTGAMEAAASTIMAAYDWVALGDVMDLGGGNGTLLIALLNEFRELRGTVLELPGPAESARKMIDAAGLSDRADAVAGDFLDRVPPGFEGYLLHAVIHNWGDDEARRILANCRQAAGEDGAVFVIERTAKPTDTSSDLRNLAWFGGKIRDEAELTTLARTAGLGVAAVHTEDEIMVLELRAA